MLSLHYDNFDELFMELNRSFLTEPDQMISYSQGIQGYNENVLITVDDYACSLDLSKFGYKSGKWPHLLRTYIDWPQLVTFKEKLGTISGMSYTYYFNQKKVNNGSCLLQIILTRPKRKGPWTKVSVNWRTSESQRRFAADLVLIHAFINELPQEHCEIDQVVFYFNQIYCSAMFINGYFEYFGLKRSVIQKNPHPWIKSMKGNYDRFFTTEDQINSYKALQRMQMLHFKLEIFEPIPIESLSIEEHFKTKE